MSEFLFALLAEGLLLCKLLVQYDRLRILGTVNSKSMQFLQRRRIGSADEAYPTYGVVAVSALLRASSASSDTQYSWRPRARSRNDAATPVQNVHIIRNTCTATRCRALFSKLSMGSCTNLLAELLQLLLQDLQVLQNVDEGGTIARFERPGVTVVSRRIRKFMIKIS